jgi:hypothetical protein
MKKAFLGLAAFGLVLASCSDPSKTELLTDGAWSVSSFKINNVEAVGTTPVYTNMKLNFTTDNAYTSSNAVDTTTGTWALVSNETILQLIQADTTNLTIELLEKSNARFSTIGGGDTIVVTTTRP